MSALASAPMQAEDPVLDARYGEGGVVVKRGDQQPIRGLGPSPSSGDRRSDHLTKSPHSTILQHQRQQRQQRQHHHDRARSTSTGPLPDLQTGNRARFTLRRAYPLVFLALLDICYTLNTIIIANNLWPHHNSTPDIGTDEGNTAKQVAIPYQIIGLSLLRALVIAVIGSSKNWRRVGGYIGAIAVLTIGQNVWEGCSGILMHREKGMSDGEGDAGESGTEADSGFGGKVGSWFLIISAALAILEYLTYLALFRLSPPALYSNSSIRLPPTPARPTHTPASMRYASRRNTPGYTPGTNRSRGGRHSRHVSKATMGSVRSPRSDYRTGKVAGGESGIQQVAGLDVEGDAVGVGVELAMRSGAGRDGREEEEEEDVFTSSAQRYPTSISKGTAHLKKRSIDHIHLRSSPYSPTQSQSQPPSTARSASAVASGSASASNADFHLRPPGVAVAFDDRATYTEHADYDSLSAGDYGRDLGVEGECCDDDDGSEYEDKDEDEYDEDDHDGYGSEDIRYDEAGDHLHDSAYSRYLYTDTNGPTSRSHNFDNTDEEQYLDWDAHHDIDDDDDIDGVSSVSSSSIIDLPAPLSPSVLPLPDQIGFSRGMTIPRSISLSDRMATVEGTDIVGSLVRRTRSARFLGKSWGSVAPLVLKGDNGPNGHGNGDYIENGAARSSSQIDGYGTFGDAD